VRQAGVRGDQRPIGSCGKRGKAVGRGGRRMLGARTIAARPAPDGQAPGGTGTPRRCVVELGGFEPPSASLRRADLHV